MNEQFDADLSRALKHGAGQELQGWEFTPAMRKSVLARIRAEESGSPAPAGSRRPVSIPRPLIWATLAAAAFMIALNIDIRGFGGAAKKESAADYAPKAASSGQSTASAPAQAPQPAEAAAKPETPALKSVESAPAAAQGAAAPGAEQKAGFSSLSIKERDARPPVASIRLEAPAAPDGSALADASASKKSGEFTLTAAVVNRFAVASYGTQVLVLDSTGLTALNHDGVADWRVPLTGASFESTLTVSQDGRVAVNADTNVYLIGRTGALESTLNLSAPATRVAWSPDGRLGVLGAAAEVYKDGKLQFKVPAAAGSQLAFGPEGGLAVLEPAGTLYVYDREGKAVATKTGISATVLAYGPDEETILTAAGAFGRKLAEPRWNMPFEPLGLTLAGNTVVVWNADRVVGLRPQDGAELWHATREGAGPGIVKVAVGAGAQNGSRLIVLGATDTGAALWAFDPVVGLMYTESLAAMPVDLTVAGNRVTLLMTGGPEVREIP